MANILTREHAEKIADKLGADRQKGKKPSGGGREHIIAVVSYEGIEIASFGIRHGSNKELPHGHITEDLHVSPNQARKLSDCTMSQTEWIEEMRRKGLIPEPQEPPQAEEPRQIVRRHGGRQRKRKG